jgi:hypothetical protein
MLSFDTLSRVRVQVGSDQTVPRLVVIARHHKLQFTNFIMLVCPSVGRCGFLSQQSRMSCCQASDLIRFKMSETQNYCGNKEVICGFGYRGRARAVTYVLASAHGESEGKCRNLL